MSALGRKQTLGSPLGHLLFEFKNQGRDGLGWASGQFPSSVVEKIYPVIKRVGMNWMAPQSASTAQS